VFPDPGWVTVQPSKNFLSMRYSFILPSESYRAGSDMSQTVLVGFGLLEPPTVRFDGSVSGSVSRLCLPRVLGREPGGVRIVL
jgi:hypothetical protein